MTVCGNCGGDSFRLVCRDCGKGLVPLDCPLSYRLEVEKPVSCPCYYAENCEKINSKK